jgi:hypothetical protein
MSSATCTRIAFFHSRSEALPLLNLKSKLFQPPSTGLQNGRSRREEKRPAATANGIRQRADIRQLRAEAWLGEWVDHPMVFEMLKPQVVVEQEYIGYFRDSDDFAQWQVQGAFIAQRFHRFPIDRPRYMDEEWPSVFHAPLAQFDRLQATKDQVGPWLADGESFQLR